MAKTPSTMLLPLGSSAPEFRLLDAEEKLHQLADYRKAKLLVVVFWCNHCPFVKHVSAGFVELAREYQQRDVALVAINSNDAEAHPDDAPDKMKVEAARADYSFDYLIDADQRIAKAYKAACTPDFFVFDAQRKLRYRGQLDESRPDNGKPVTGKDLRAALDGLLAGQPLQERQRASLGCNIKWKPGNEPEYYGG